MSIAAAVRPPCSIARAPAVVIHRNGPKREPLGASLRRLGGVLGNPLGTPVRPAPGRPVAEHLPFFRPSGPCDARNSARARLPPFSLQQTARSRSVKHNVTG